MKAQRWSDEAHSIHLVFFYASAILHSAHSFLPRPSIATETSATFFPFPLSACLTASSWWCCCCYASPLFSSITFTCIICLRRADDAISSFLEAAMKLHLALSGPSLLSSSSAYRLNPLPFPRHHHLSIRAPLWQINRYKAKSFTGNSTKCTIFW